jgi:hypothetical protein
MPVILAAALAFGASGVALADDGLLNRNLNLHVYGVSYHTDREGSRRAGLNNELNPGLGLNYILHEDERGIRFVEAGFYQDSGRHVAKLAGVGYQYKLYQQWRLGGALALMQSHTYNHGRAFVAPLPILTYDFGRAKVNALYVPRYGDYNQFAVFGLYLSVPLRQ